MPTVSKKTILRLLFLYKFNVSINTKVPINNCTIQTIYLNPLVDVQLVFTRFVVQFHNIKNIAYCTYNVVIVVVNSSTVLVQENYDLISATDVHS